ncbi:hypothetical protein SO694_00039280 [Aureococcus anophagefferens]|uniref:DUF389 domain-containing protein n=1 Tax=Aureococcus anophagefferens TaxID=44056 RepID=A0ABR1FLN7_AURAN
MQRLVKATVPERYGDSTVEEIMLLDWVGHVDESAGSRILAKPCDDVAGDECRTPEMRKTVRVGVRILAFKVRDIHLSATLKALRRVGVGEHFGAIDVLDVRTTTERATAARRSRRGRCCPSLGDRLSTLEIHATIEAGSHLTADHCCCVVLASFIAAIGLLSDASSIVLAAFFISPLMTMLLGATWGACVGEWRLARRALRNMALDACICVAVGGLVGAAIGLLLPHSVGGLTAPMHAGAHGKAWGSITVNSGEILSRGPPVSNLVLSAFVATFSGVALALGYSGGISSALAGVAVSTALLPPLVNAGLMTALSVAYPTARSQRGDTLLLIAYNSLAIYVVNVCLVCGLSYVTLKFKRVGGRSLSGIRQVFAPTPRSSAHAWHDSNVDHRHTWPDDSNESKSFCALDETLSPRDRLDSLPDAMHLSLPAAKPRARTLDGDAGLAVPLLAAAESPARPERPASERRRPASAPPCPSSPRPQKPPTTRLIKPRVRPSL